MNSQFRKIFRFYIQLILLIIISSFGSTVFSQEKKAVPQNPKLLDFEADIIEGERAVPNIFVEMDIHKSGLDLVLYQRNNFNDFHAAEKNRRPRYFNIKKSAQRGK